MLFWLLLAALLLLCLVALGLALLALWRRVKVLGGLVSEVGVTMGEASEALSAVQAPVRAAAPCPTCGAPASAAVPADARRLEPSSMRRGARP